MTSPNFVKVRIACVATSQGAWAAYGNSSCSEDAAAKVVYDELDDVGSLSVVEAWLPVPGTVPAVPAPAEVLEALHKDNQISLLRDQLNRLQSRVWQLETSTKN